VRSNPRDTAAPSDLRFRDVGRGRVDRAEAESVRHHRLVAGWARAWGVPGLEERVDIAFSARFRTSLGRCQPATGRIRLAAFLLAGPDEILHETLCHEAAHAAVYELHGGGPRPHGPEWKALMRAAGFPARARVPAELVPGLAPPRRRRARPRRRLSLLRWVRLRVAPTARAPR
jgi:hypothetical protein